MSTTALRKHDGLADLISLASAVDTSVPVNAAGYLSAREAARTLAGVASWLGRGGQANVRRMQQCMASLARWSPAWAPGDRLLYDLPTMSDGRVDETIAMIAVCASTMVRLFGPVNLRAAVAYWASESDPASWQKILWES